MFLWVLCYLIVLVLFILLLFNSKNYIIVFHKSLLNTLYNKREAKVIKHLKFITVYGLVISTLLCLQARTWVLCHNLFGYSVSSTIDWIRIPLPIVIFTLSMSCLFLFFKMRLDRQDGKKVSIFSRVIFIYLSILLIWSMIALFVQSWKLNIDGSYFEIACCISLILEFIHFFNIFSLFDYKWGYFFQIYGLQIPWNGFNSQRKGFNFQGTELVLKGNNVVCMATNPAGNNSSSTGSRPSYSRIQRIFNRINNSSSPSSGSNVPNYSNPSSSSNVNNSSSSSVPDSASIFNQVDVYFQLKPLTINFSLQKIQTRANPHLVIPLNINASLMDNIFTPLWEEIKNDVKNLELTELSGQPPNYRSLYTWEEGKTIMNEARHQLDCYAISVKMLNDHAVNSIKAKSAAMDLARKECLNSPINHIRIYHDMLVANWLKSERHDAIVREVNEKEQLAAQKIWRLRLFVDGYLGRVERFGQVSNPRTGSYLIRNIIKGHENDYDHLKMVRKQASAVLNDEKGDSFSLGSLKFKVDPNQGKIEVDRWGVD